MCVLPPGIYIVITVINHHGLGQKLSHPGGAIRQEKHLGCGREPGGRGQSSKVGGAKGVNGGVGEGGDRE